jgi:hypothetical protein
MTTALTPELALAYLAALEPAVDALAILGEGGGLLAGDPNLAAQAHGGAPGIVTARGARHTLVACSGDGVLEPLLRHDLEAVVRELDR